MLGSVAFPNCDSLDPAQRGLFLKGIWLNYANRLCCWKEAGRGVQGEGRRSLEVGRGEL